MSEVRHALLQEEKQQLDDIRHERKHLEMQTMALNMLEQQTMVIIMQRMNIMNKPEGIKRDIRFDQKTQEIVVEDSPQIITNAGLKGNHGRHAN